MPVPALVPFWETTDKTTVRLFRGDAADVMSRMPPASCHCLVTSPPYWGLRDYGVEGQLGQEARADCGTLGRARCGGCFVCSMTTAFGAAARVLRPDGVAWLNLGDTYSSKPPGTAGQPRSGRGWSEKMNPFSDRRSDEKDKKMDTVLSSGLGSGNLVGVPWRVALALQANGWYLRQDVIWHKPSPMPESVTSRCTKAHEYVFLLTRNKAYFYDNEAVKVPGSDGDGTANLRSVWTMTNGGYPGAHFATFPEELPTRCIKAGTSEAGCCPECGKCWRRVVESESVATRPGATGKHGTPDEDVRGPNMRRRTVRVSETTGWVPGCRCGEAHDPVPCTVIDPFMGSGTTAAVSVRLGRRCVGIELSASYLKEHAVTRVEGALTSIPALAHLAGRAPRAPVLLGGRVDTTGAVRHGPS